MILRKSVFILLTWLISSCYTQNPTQENTPPIVHDLRILEPEPIENVYGKNELRLECTVSGNPLPTLEWSFDGEKFEPEKAFRSTEENAPVNHEISANRLILRKVKGKTKGVENYYNSGRYRCIATNTVGSVFLEKNIQIRVMGYFMSGSREGDPTQKKYVAAGRTLSIECPPHVMGYGTVYSWGIFRKTESSNKVVERYPPGQINDHLFYTATEGKLVYAVVTLGDIKESQDVGGLRCILSNGDEESFSKQVEIWDYDAQRGDKKVEFEYYKPDIVAILPKRMNAELNTAYTMTCGATGYPIPKISWEYQGFPVVPRFNGSRELNFEFFQILGGGYQLKIQRVTEYSGGTFKCYAENSLGRVWVEGQLSVTHSPKWTKLFPEVIDLTLEKNLYLLCNATGNPRPTFEWFQNSTALKTDLHKRTNGSNQTGSFLIIEKATFEDNGIYICVAYNDLDTITQSVYIKVESMAPKFLVPLDNMIYLFRTSTMYIPCDPAGGPIPTKEWRKSGVLIESGGRFVVHTSGTLEIKNVQKSDEGEYECTATNTNGQASSSGTAVVLEPTIITNPPENQTHEVGWPFVEIFCGASWDPRLDLRIEWFKGDVRMTKFTAGKIYMEDRAMGPPRILYINNLTIDDTGKYTCHAYTKVGNIISEQKADAWLNIKGPPQPPAGVQVSGDCEYYDPIKPPELVWTRGEELNEETRTFYIEFSTNISSSYNDWFGGEGNPEIPGSRLIAEPGTRVKFTLEKQHLVPGADLIFRITAATEHQKGLPSRPSPPGQCKTPKGKPVINPLNVSSYAKEPGSFIIKWRAVTNVYQGADGFYYEVGYRKMPSDGAFTQQEIRDLNTTEYEVLTPGTNETYEFYVRSHNEQGPGPEPKIITNSSGANRPESAPAGFHVRLIERFGVELGWQPVYGATGYKVTYWNVSDAESQRGRNKRDAHDTEKKVEYFLGKDFATGGTLRNVTAELDYVAKVAAVNSGGEGDESDLIEFTTQSRIPGQPSNVKFQIYGRSAHISWNPPLEPNGYIEQYEISWYETTQQETDDDRARSTVQLKTMDRRSREEYLIETFQPLRYYTVRLLARNRMGPGQNWQQELVAVSAPDMPGKPGQPKATPFDDTSINVTFQRPSYGGLPSKFMVYYRPTGEYYSEPKVMSQEFPQRAWILVKDLDFLVYDFWTVGVNDLGQSETSDVTEQQPIRRPKPQAHASDFEWYRSNWFVAVMICIFFILITLVVIFILLRSGPQTYKRLKENGYDNGYGGSYNRGATQMQPIETKVQLGAGVGAGAAVVGATAAYDARNQSASDEPSDQQDLPPRYSSQSSVEKKGYSDESDESRSGSGSDYSESESESETGSDYSGSSRSRSGSGSYYSDEEKKRETESEEEEENDDDLSTFV